MQPSKISQLIQMRSIGISDTTSVDSRCCYDAFSELARTYAKASRRVRSNACGGRHGRCRLAPPPGTGAAQDQGRYDQSDTKPDWLPEDAETHEQGERQS